MDYMQRLKWIEKVFHSERAGNTQSPPVDRIKNALATSDTPVNLPVKHVSLFRPEHYEPGYAYPLVIWLHADGGSEHDLHEVMPQISLRNYLGLSFRAPAIDPADPAGGYHWPDSQLYVKQFADTIQQTVQELKKVLNIHERRIYLVGTGTGCSVATKLLMLAPHFFAGAALFNGCFKKTDFQSTGSVNLQGKRVLLDHRIAINLSSQISSQWVTRMWETTGSETRIVNALEAETQDESELLVALDRWIMEGISTAWLV
ncbi:MAG: hypothetical protein K0U82_05960 [Planctomycetes bacterium]|nr:hypothetical protein [Planctomycetota bacterium]